MKGFQKKHIEYKRPEVYAVIYSGLRLIFYNTGFTGDTKLFIMIPGGKEEPHAKVL